MERAIKMNYKKFERKKHWEEDYTVIMNEKELKKHKKTLAAFNLVINYLKKGNLTYVQAFMDSQIEDMKKNDDFCVYWLNATKEDIKEIIKRTKISNKAEDGVKILGLNKK